jgi:hypothetical protein
MKVEHIGGYMHLKRVISVILLFTFSTVSALGGETGGGMLYPGTGTEVNGAIVAVPTAIFSGNSIRTSSASALFTADRLSIRLAGNSLMVYVGESVDLSCGVVSVTASRPLELKISGVTAITSLEPAEFDVAAAKGKVSVAVRKGTVSVGDRRHGEVVSAGSTGQLAVGGGCALQSSNVPTPAVQSTSTGVSGKKIGIIVGAAAAAGVAAAVAGRGKETPVSPSQP